MFKKIPQDNVTRRLFTVHKENKLTQDDVNVYQVHDVAGSYDADTDPLVGASGSFPGYSVRGLYNSAKLRYYNPNVMEVFAITLQIICWKMGDAFKVRKIIDDLKKKHWLMAKLW